MIFVDTSAWFANLVTKEKNHAAAVAWTNDNHEDLVTSDFVVDETLTLLRARYEESQVQTLGNLFFNAHFVEIIHITEDDVRLAWHLFRDYSDKQWSFTDCTSKVIMQRLGIKKAFAFDHHFRQFRDIEVVP